MELEKVGGWPEQTKTYIEEVKAEMKRVTWPSWPQVRATTGVVIGAVFLFAGYFFVIDTAISKGISKIIDHFTK
jgi:preprotein translocase subunit SecE